MRFFNDVPDSGLVRRSAKFSDVCTLAIALCFFLSVDVGMVELATTDLLTQKAYDGPSIGIPNILSLQRNDSSISARLFIAANSGMKVEDSTVL